LFYESLEEESSDSEDEKPRRHHKHNSNEESDDSSDEESSYDSGSSDSDSEDDRKPGRGKKNMHRKREAILKKAKKLSMQPSKVEKKPNNSKGEVAEMTERLRRMELMFGKITDQKDEDITRDLRNVPEPTNRQLAQLVERVAQEVQENRNDTQALLDRRQMRDRNSGLPNRCFMCKLAGTHAWGSSNCPDAQALVREGHCIFDQGRIYMADGSDMPKVGPTESIAAAIRGMAKAKRAGLNRVPATGPNRIPISGNRAPQISYVHMINKENVDEEVYDDSDEVAPAMWHHDFAAERTENPSNRFDPIDRGKRVQWKSDQRGARANVPQRMTPYVEVPPVPKQWGNARKPFNEAQNKPVTTPNENEQKKEASRSPPAPVQILKPPARNQATGAVTRDNTQSNDRNEQAPRLKDQPNIRKSDFVMQGDPRIPNPSPEKILPRSPAKNRFTTTMRQKYQSEEVYQKVLDVNVTLPLGELLAVCPDIERSISNETKLRTVPVTHINAGRGDEEMIDIQVNQCHVHATPLCSEYETVEPPWEEGYIGQPSPELANPEWTDGMVARAAESEGRRDQAVASTGTLTIRVDGRDIIAMVDSGAEMNMVTPQLADVLRNSYAEDESGKRMQMKNVSGVINSLKGRFNDIPIEVGGHRLVQTLFVGDQWDSHFEMILGQSFLRKYACEMSWCEDDGDYIHMRIYPSGSKRGNSIFVRLNKKEGNNRPVNVRLAEAFSSSRIDSGEDRPTQGMPEEAPMDDDWIMTPWQESGSDCSCLAEKASSDEAPSSSSSESSNERKDYEGGKLDAMFNQARNCAEQSENPSMDPVQLEDALMTYHNRSYARTHQIPIGSHVLEIEDGQQIAAINDRLFQATLDPKANYNLISQQCRDRAGLTSKKSQGYESIGQAGHPDFEYCLEVPLRLCQGPKLPGTFLVVDDSDAQGYDVVLGKPWMLGIEERYKNFQFETTEDRQGSEGQEQRTKRPHQEDSLDDEPNKRTRPSPKEPDIPSLGGQVAKTL
jgi:hypothetical protein